MAAACREKVVKSIPTQKLRSFSAFRPRRQAGGVGDESGTGRNFLYLPVVLSSFGAQPFEFANIRRAEEGGCLYVVFGIVS